MNLIYLKRAMWSPNFSQRMTGYDDRGTFHYTPALYATCRENEYTTAEGQVYVVQSWAPDGSGYRDEKGKK